MNGKMLLHVSGKVFFNPALETPGGSCSGPCLATDSLPLSSFRKSLIDATHCRVLTRNLNLLNEHCLSCLPQERKQTAELVSVSPRKPKLRESPYPCSCPCSPVNINTILCLPACHGGGSTHIPCKSPSSTAPHHLFLHS